MSIPPDDNQLRALLTDVRESCRTMLREHAAPSRPVVSADAEIGMALMARLPAADAHALRESGPPRGEALSAARRGDDARARDAMRRAGALADDRVLTRAGVLTIRTLNAAAASYVDYRVARYEDAHRGMLDALASTNDLQDAFPLMTQRRVHLVTNLVHMEVRRGRSADAVALAWPLLDFIEGNTAAWPLPDYEGNATPEIVDATARARMADTLVCEVAAALDVSGDGAYALMQPGRAHTGAAAQRQPCRDLMSAHAWLQLKCWELDGDVTSFLAGAAVFLGLPRIGGSTLWRAVASDVIRCCAALGTPDADATRVELSAALAE